MCRHNELGCLVVMLVVVCTLLLSQFFWFGTIGILLALWTQLAAQYWDACEDEARRNDDDL